MPISRLRAWLRLAANTLLVLCAVGLLLLFAVAPGRIMASRNPVLAPPPYPVSQAAHDLHQSLLVVDLHCDALLWSRDILIRDTRGQVDVPRMLDGNVALQAFTAVTRSPAGMNIDATEDKHDVLIPLTFFQAWPMKTWFSAKERAMYQASRFQKALDRSGGVLVGIRSREDLASYLDRRESTPAITAGFLGVEGLHCLEGDLENVRVLFNAGYRMMAPTHFFDNELGGSAHGMEKGGLSPFGREVIHFMEQLKIIVDLAHASPSIIDDVLDMATRPVLVSHTGVKGTCDNSRNLSDDHVKRIAEGGGIIGIGFWDTAVCGEDVASIVRAIRYAADLAGWEHVALGSDFDGSVRTPFDIGGMALITEGLLGSGMEEEAIRGIMGGNVIQFLGQMLPSEGDTPEPDKQPPNAGT